MPSPAPPNSRDIYAGGRKVFNRRSSYEGIIDRVRSGLPYHSLDVVAARFEISPESLVRVAGLLARTMARRKKERRLHADESDRLLRTRAHC